MPLHKKKEFYININKQNIACRFEASKNFCTNSTKICPNAGNLVKRLYLNVHSSWAPQRSKSEMQQTARETQEGPNTSEFLADTI